MTDDHPLGFTCEDINDRVADLELVLADHIRRLTKAEGNLSRSRIALSRVLQHSNDEDAVRVIASEALAASGQ